MGIRKWNPKNTKISQWESRLSDLKGPETSKLDWRYLEPNKIDRNELQVCTNSQKDTGTKITEKLNNLEKFERKKSNFSPVLNPDTS